MRLEDIGFYTLSDNRAKTSSQFSPLYRCELILTDRCNFKCPYCRGLQNGNDLPFATALQILNYWISERLINIRFSGGEPTLYKHLISLIHIAKKGKIKRIAVSTNGGADLNLYKQLINAGVNDFSISLDACCTSTGDIMAGKKGSWKRVIENIKQLSQLTYISVGIVVNENNNNELEKTILLAHKLGVKDIRIIPSAQYNKKLQLNIPNKIINEHPILKYRLQNNRHIRGLNKEDSKKCKLVLDDMAIWNGEHYPCIIYLREQGKAIGRISKNTRLERFNWYQKHDSWQDKICKNNCLDVCIAFNNKAI